MLQLVRFGKSVQIFDTEKHRFVKSTRYNIAQALGQGRQAGSSIKEMLASVAWQKCPGCRLGKQDPKNPQLHEHWIFGSYRESR